MYNNYDYEINLIDLCKNLLKKWKTIVLCAVLLGGMFGIHALVSNKTYNRAQSTIVVVNEKNPVEQMNIINRSDVVSAALSICESSVSVDEASKNVSVSRQPYSNEIVIVYKTVENNATVVLRQITNNAINAINGINDYKVELKDSAFDMTRSKEGPSFIKRSALGLFFGGAIAVGWYVVKYVFENKIRDEEFVQEIMGLKVLGNIAGNGDDYKILRTNLIFGSGDAKVLSFGYFDEESKEVIKEVAHSFVNIGKRVLVVDETESAVGLLTLLGGEDSLETLIVKGDYDILPLGQNENGTDLVQDNKMNQLLEQWSNNYDYIIFNNSLVTENSTSLVLNAKSDEVVLVVKKDVTSATKLFKYNKDLELVKAKVAGVVYIN